MSTKKPATKSRAAAKRATERVLVLRTCNPDMSSYNGFVWPEKGRVKCSDWDPAPHCGNGLHGLLWGEGDGSLLDFAPGARALVVRVEEEAIVDLGRKVKFPSGEVVFCGELKAAADYISEHGGAGRAIASGTATAGDSGTATAGYSGTATAGDRGTATAGDSGTATAGYGGTATAGYGGTATAGDRGTATAGYRGTATAGYGGTICIQYWNGKRHKMRIAQVKDEDGDGELEPNTPYRLDEKRNFVKAEGRA